MEVLMYDKGPNVRRLLENRRRILDAAEGSLELSIDTVDRVEPFPGSKSIEEIVGRVEANKEPFPYDAVIINGEGEDAYFVLTYLITLFDEIKLDHNRLIYLGNVPESNGACYVNIPSGNGYLAEKDTVKIIDVLYELNDIS